DGGAEFGGGSGAFGCESSVELVLLAVCVFFFQAEDGIRDKLVTGVQTCALPISVRTALVGRLAAWRAGVPMVHHLHSPTTAETRSEERRVGKECRSRWAPYT